MFFIGLDGKRAKLLIIILLFSFKITFSFSTERWVSAAASHNQFRLIFYMKNAGGFIPVSIGFCDSIFFRIMSQASRPF